VRPAAPRPLADLLHEPLFVPRTTPIKRLFLTFKQKKVHMAIVVSEYGKVLGLVTMDDLLAQIFGVLRDERAALQQSIKPGSRRAPTPLPGVPAGPMRDDQSVPVRADSDPGKADSGPVGTIQREDTRPGSDVNGILDPPPLHSPVHPPEEITPPAVDISDLVGDGKHS
jgi:hypothetical protein